MATVSLSQQFPWVAQAAQAVGNGRNTDAVLGKTPVHLRAGVQALSFHVLRQWAWAHAITSQLVKKKPDAELAIWLTTAVALLREPRLYDAHTVVDQAVQTCRDNHRLAGKAAFVNACLRRLLREYAALDAVVMADESVRFNHPQWWIDRLRTQYPDHWAAMLQVNQVAGPMVLRVNVAQQSLADYQARLAAEGIVATPVGDQGLVLAKPLAVGRLPGFDSGAVSVQDASPQMAAPLIWASAYLQAAVTAGRPLRILDACAAPGGKTGHLLELAVARSRAVGQPMTTRVTALEISPKRAARIHEALDRLALSAHADVQVADGKLPQKWWDGQPWDAVLLDVPCTASGIVRRHPDVPWLRRPADIDQLVAEQRALLEMAWSHLAVGGRLVYCTCSTFKEEGEWQIDAFLEQHPDAQRVEAPGHVLPGRVNAALDANLNDAALVHAAFDGFFYAAFDKRAS